MESIMAILAFIGFGVAFVGAILLLVSAFRVSV
jgi:hypothetical protein